MRKPELPDAKSSLHCKTRTSLNIVKSTHLCCDIVKEFDYTLVVS